MSSSAWTWDIDELSDEVTVPGITILGKLGQGGMGEVYRGRDATGRDVAVKILRGMDARSQDRFEREAELLARFKAPQIVGAHSWGTTRELCYLVCDLIEGRELLAAAESLDLPARLDLFLEVVRAVGVAHSAGVVHRDLKPSNILIGDDDRVRLIDFGLSIGLDQERLTRTHQLVGTPAYLPPERLASSEPLPANDVWSLGAIGFELLTGKLPYAAETFDELVRRFSPPPRLNAPVPRAVKRVVRRALDPNPSVRFPDANAFGAALTAALAAAPMARRWWIAGGVVCGLILLGAQVQRAAAPGTPPAEVSDLPPTRAPSLLVSPSSSAPPPAAVPAAWPLAPPPSATLTKAERKRLNRIYDFEAKGELEFLNDLMKRGHPQAFRAIALLRFLGSTDLPQDRRLGYELLVRSLKYGCRAAGSDLAMLYVSGIALPRGLELMTYRDHARALALPDNPRLAAALAFLGKTSQPPRGTSSSTKLLEFLVAKHHVVAPRTRPEAYAIVQRELDR